HQERPTVIATARWDATANASTDHLQSNPSHPSDDHWTAIDGEVRAALARAANAPPDPTLDDGTFPTTAKPQARASKSAKIGALGWIAAILVLGAIGAALYFLAPYLDLLPGRGNANGEACKIDSDCRSNNCRHKRCEANERSRGDRCISDSECRSNKCKLRICD
nr:hypothetical protein [Deltaproteobacteria bacterium]